MMLARGQDFQRLKQSDNLLLDMQTVAHRGCGPQNHHAVAIDREYERGTPNREHSEDGSVFAVSLHLIVIDRLALCNI